MEELWKVLSDAHAELLNATGWGVLLDGFTASLSDGGSGIVNQIYQHVNDFVGAVNWSEPFFKYLALFHTFVIILAVLLTWRASPERLFAVILLLLFLGWCSPYLNDYGRAHAEAFFEEKGVNYFDHGGLFICVVYWGPLFLMALLLQGRLLLQMLGLMIKTKRQQLKREMRKAKAKAEDTATTTTSSFSPSEATVPESKKKA